MKSGKKPKHFIFICHGKDCLKNGAKEVQKQFERQLKATQSKNHCELIKTRCMDHCKEGPSLVVDNTWYGKVSPRDVDKLLNKKAVN